MADEQAKPSLSRRAFSNAARLALVVCTIGCGLQAATAWFNCSKESSAEAISSDSADLGCWTFAGEGLAVSVKSATPETVNEELTASASVESEPPPLAEGEARLLELLASLGPGERLANGGSRWRQSFAGIDAFAETRRVNGKERLAVARAAMAGPEGLTLLEIRPSASSGGNGKAADGAFAVSDGANEIARRVAPTGETTGKLLTTDAMPEQAAAEVKRTMSARGWTIDDIAVAEETSAKSFACQKGRERMQVVVFRNEGIAGQTMILGLRE